MKAGERIDDLIAGRGTAGEGGNPAANGERARAVFLATIQPTSAPSRFYSGPVRGG
jgi:hypothetical protein